MATILEIAVMTCILVAHLGGEVVVAADKRATRYEADGSLTVLSDDVQKIVRTPAGIVTGCGMVEMLNPVKDHLSTQGFATTDEVFELIQHSRNTYANANATSSRLAADLARTGWLFTYPSTANGQDVTRAVFFHPSLSTESFAVVGEGRVKCLPAGFSHEQARELEARLQAVVSSSLNNHPYAQAKQEIIKCMRLLMSEVAETSISVSSVCDVAVVNGSNVEFI
ncbi:hypothetical protein NPS33_27750 [Pseudomonas putida]|uniref:hypothetical protein n=1 Tax=Pseudomonas putida TaxID=303 RepID=UPI0023645DC7|nr:hypothetical protein [Pseudomonas putida]MDD2018631.1 hypothetical protein [Pseudomonas putida]HDS1775340.1 hypothetical protein [Pseudomonas putida]